MGSLIGCWMWFGSRPVVQGVIPDGRDPDRTLVMPAWYHAGVVGTCWWHTNDGSRAAEHAVPADRCAREIVAFLNASPSALAAAELFRWAATYRLYTDPIRSLC